tara:strand:+ start:10154 stop:11428 length:1275 start_codon:yes stop_codon:yes gene_type:complete
MVLDPTGRHETTAHLLRDAMAFVLAGGRGSRLMELTDRRAKPAVYFGGKSRIIDFALSNAVNSGIRRIGIATQYRAHSLIRHMQRGWNFFRAERREMLDILPASQRTADGQWYLGTADAVYQNIDIIESYAPEYIIILAGDHIYRQDYGIMLKHHVESGADVTVGCIELGRAEATGFGVMHIDENDRISAFFEKPADPPAMPGKPDRALASMGIYVFATKTLFEVLRRDAEDSTSDHDFGKNVIPYMVENAKAVAHQFSQSCVMSGSEREPYWRDVGTLDSFWQANIDLMDPVPELDLNDTAWPIWTYSELTPPAKFIGAPGPVNVDQSMVSGGCVVRDADILNSLLFSGVQVGSKTHLERAVALPYCEIGDGARLSNVILDRGVVVPAGLVVGEDAGSDAARFRRSEGGVTLITQPMIDALEA